MLLPIINLQNEIELCTGNKVQAVFCKDETFYK